MLERVRQVLDARPDASARGGLRLPLSAAIWTGRCDIARLLLERGADPNWEPQWTKGRALHAAARACELWLVELLLAHGANQTAASTLRATPFFAAGTPEIKRLLESYGATSDPYDINWLSDERTSVRRLGEGPASASRLGAAFHHDCRIRRRRSPRETTRRGLRVPPVITGCQGYLLHNARCFARSLERGMNPNLMNWQLQTLLHLVCHGPNSTGSDGERAAIAARRRRRHQRSRGSVPVNAARMGGAPPGLRSFYLPRRGEGWSPSAFPLAWPSVGGTLKQQFVSESKARITA